MTPSQFEIVTALTIGSIGAIILLYFIVLKRKGWLTNESSPETSYLCPNPQCRKIFQTPITLTDLSTRPPRAYVACPHCGLDLDTVAMLKPEKSKTNDKIMRPKKPQVTAEDLAARSKTSKSEMPVEMQVSKIPESRSIFTADTSADLRKSEVLPESKSSVQTLEIGDGIRSKAGEKPMVQGEKKSSQSSRDCPHFFGYVRSLPRNTPIPDECLGCPWIVECLTHAEKVEA